jgi:hypothetical protein
MPASRGDTGVLIGEDVWHPGFMSWEKTQVRGDRNDGFRAIGGGAMRIYLRAPFPQTERK